MQNKTKFETLAILSSVLFAATLTISLTVQPAVAICSSKSGACTTSNLGVTDASTHKTSAHRGVISSTGVLGYGSNSFGDAATACGRSGVCEHTAGGAGGNGGGGVGGLP